MTGTAVCEKCHRPLKDEVSRRRRYGPVCFRREFGPSAPKPRGGTTIPAAARPVDHHPVDPDQIPLPLEVRTVDAETRKAAIDAVARHALFRKLDYAVSVGDILWEDYPDLGEFQWDSVLERILAIAKSVRPTDEEYRAAYEHLADAVSANDDSHPAATVQEGQN
ncbi:DUF6011 domain-containing protein [Amycolatopsis rubida]|uniref:Uncharacterized protein n=1 Tax=Amycolatopsis rubida TaxID=112413 RepID=A0A1I5IJY7_9PSEU|nr:DUF6011 domain-containing protein [Amycolatopsis rubida]SFO60451.1 hypothetical protein SAMN05421854_102497 [Amycolatopsis rubida]